MAGSTTNRKCLFCGSPADSQEHVIAGWLSKRMGIQDLELEPAIFSEDVGFKKHPKIRAGKFKSKQVCKRCNNEWMSELETWFEKRLGQLVESSWPTPINGVIQNIRTESDLLIRWMIKLAVVFQRMTPRGLQQAVPDSINAMAKNGVLTNDFCLMIAHIQTPRLTAQLLKGFPVWNAGVYHEYQVHKEGFTFGVCLNHLAIRIIKCPNATPIIKAHSTLSGVPAVPLLVKPSLKYAEQVLHSFPDFQSFWDTLEVSVNWNFGNSP